MRIYVEIKNHDIKKNERIIKKMIKIINKDYQETICLENIIKMYLVNPISINRLEALNKRFIENDVILKKIDPNIHIKMHVEKTPEDDAYKLYARNPFAKSKNYIKKDKKIEKNN